MSFPKRFCGTLALLAALPSLAAGQTMAAAAPPVIQTHDNLRPAGVLRDGVLRLSFWAGVGRWSPGGASDTLDVAAFGEEGRPLSIPSPLIRASAGTAVRLTIRNTLREPLRVTGFCDKPGPCEGFVVAPGAIHDVRFTLVRPGTFHYWGSTGPTLDERHAEDSQLGGAIIADAPGETPADKVFVLGLKRKTVAPGNQDLAVINGRSWPDTERLTYQTGDPVRWRVVNLTLDSHAMHLHGFYFKVTSLGDGRTDTIYEDPQVREAVTEWVPPGRTITLSWTPHRAGNWLFHCHMLAHMMPSEHEAHAVTTADPPGAGMAGLVLGVTVTGADRQRPRPEATPRQLQMTLEHDTRHGPIPSYKVALESDGQPMPRVGGAAPGPVMVLTRGEPVAVDVVNRLREPSAIHWHGIELESYDDGVPGFGGTAGSVTPPIAPGGTFTARFTPSRAGTFIYHTHWHNPGQLAGGIYGPLLVLEPGESYTPDSDHVMVIAFDGDYEGLPEPMTINGERTPRPILLAPGVVNRLRLINITPNNVSVTVQLLNRFDPVQWRPVGKDGASIPEAQRTPRIARQLITVGETYDFEVTPGSGPWWLELRRGSGELLLQWAVRVR